MSRGRLIAAAAGNLLVLLSTAGLALAGQASSRDLVIDAGRPLRVVLSKSIRVTRVGQPVTATLAEDVYAYDRVVIPAGATVLGQVARLDGVSGATRAVAMLGGNFSPGHLVGLRFNTVVLGGGSKVAIQTIVTPGTAPSSQEVAGAHDDGIVGHARRQVALEAKRKVAEARRAVATVKAPGKLTRLGHYLVGRLPVHPQYLEAGSAFNAELVEPITLGKVEPLPPAPDGTRPPAESILSARLLTPLDSKSTVRGAPVKAVLTQPLLSSDRAVILPEGTVVSGKVTLVKPARGLRRNGQLRFLFESLEVPGRSTEAVAAALFSADVGRDQHLQIDEEGGTKVTNPKSRFVAPALASAAMVVPLEQTEISDEAAGALTTEANVAGHGVKGFSGFGLLGAGLAIVSRPAAVAFGAFGLAQAVYTSVLGKGHDVVFPINTPIQMRLSPGESRAQ
jgi:hypothetical protein